MQRNFQQLLMDNTWVDVRKCILREYPNQKKNITAFKIIFFDLQKLMPGNSDLEIVLHEYKDEIANADYIDVGGIKKSELKKKKPELWGLDFIEWKNVLAMPVNKRTLAQYSEAEIIAHTLWEITVYGFDEKKIEREKRKIFGK